MKTKTHSSQSIIGNRSKSTIDNHQSTIPRHFPKRRSNLRTRQVEGETVVLDRDGGLVHQLNQTASYVWQRLDGKTSVKGLARQLVGVFEVDPKTAEKDTARILSELERLNLLEP